MGIIVNAETVEKWNIFAPCFQYKNQNRFPWCDYSCR